MSREEKLQAIRQQAQREKAESVQREQAQKVSKTEREKRRTGIRLKELLVVPIALAVGLWLLNHYSQPAPEKEDFVNEYEAIAEARDKTVAYAALHHLQRQGWNINLVSELTARPLGSNGHFKIHLGYNGKSVEFVTKQACQPNDLDLKAQRDPDCYIWPNL